MYEPFKHGDLFYSIVSEKFCLLEFTSAAVVSLHTFQSGAPFGHSMTVYPIGALDVWRAQVPRNWKYIGNIAQWLGEPK